MNVGMVNAWRQESRTIFLAVSNKEVIVPKLPSRPAMKGCEIDGADGFVPENAGTLTRNSCVSAGPLFDTRRRNGAQTSHASKPPAGFASFGFTLLELLVVIVVIAILAALLLPALSRARQAAENAVCQSNLGQQGIGLAMYVNEFGAYPRYYSTTFPPERRYWMQLLQHYVGDKWPEDSLVRGSVQVARQKGVYACPGYNRVGGFYYHPWSGHPGTDDSLSQWLFAGSGAYAYNASDGFLFWGGGAGSPWLLKALGGNGAGEIFNSAYGFGGKAIGKDYPYYGSLGAAVEAGRPIREAEVISPTRMISIGDSTIDPPYPSGPDMMGAPVAPAFWHLADATFSSEQEDRALTPQDKAMLRRHGGRWNELFCDGHVENGRLETFFDWRKDEVLKLWNRDNQPHREQFQVR